MEASDSIYIPPVDFKQRRTTAYESVSSYYAKYKNILSALFVISALALDKVGVKYPVVIAIFGLIAVLSSIVPLWNSAEKGIYGWKDIKGSWKNLILNLISWIFALIQFFALCALIYSMFKGIDKKNVTLKMTAAVFSFMGITQALQDTEKSYKKETISKVLAILAAIIIPLSVAFAMSEKSGSSGKKYFTEGASVSMVLLTCIFQFMGSSSKVVTQDAEFFQTIIGVLGAFGSLVAINEFNTFKTLIAA